MDFHKRLRKIRKDKDLSYQKIANACGVSWQTVQQWCRDGGPFPKIENLEPLASLLETTPWYLLFGVDAAGNLSNTEEKTALSDEADELIQCVVRLDGLGALAREAFTGHLKLLALAEQMLGIQDADVVRELHIEEQKLASHLEQPRGQRHAIREHKNKGSN